MRAGEAYIKEIGVINGDPGKQVELIGPLGRVPAHVITLDVNLSGRYPSGHKKVCRRCHRHRKDELQQIYVRKVCQSRLQAAGASKKGTSRMTSRYVRRGLSLESAQQDTKSAVHLPFPSCVPAALTVQRYQRKISGGDLRLLLLPQNRHLPPSA